jgi:hypothetical protein
VAGIWEHALKGTYTLLISPAIVAELANVLREKFKWPEGEIKARAKRFPRIAEIITPIITSWPVPERDRQSSLFPVISICIELKSMRASQLSAPLISSILLQVTHEVDCPPQGTKKVVREIFESVTESKAESIEDIRRIVERWGELLKPHQNSGGKVTQPRWVKCWEMWQELAQVIHQNHQG